MMSMIEERGYALSEVLVSTDWVAGHLNDPNVRIVESNEDPLLYVSGHIPGAVEVDWTRDLTDPIRRDYIDRDGFEQLVTRCGIRQDTTVVFYGDKCNWWASYAFWVFALFGHKDLRLMDGGRSKWAMEGRLLMRETPRHAWSTYQAPLRDDHTNRAYRDDVLRHIESGKPLVDVRTSKEYSGVLLQAEGYPNEGALRGGHIPGAKNILWSLSVQPEDGTFKPANQLRAVYEGMHGLHAEDDVIIYCRIGERSCHSWFVLKYLLGYQKVRNYDGSWTEWGNLVGVPIER